MASHDAEVVPSTSGRHTFEADLFGRVLPLARSWRSALDHELAGLGISGAAGRTLLLIDQLGDQVRQIDLAAGLDINSASIVRLVDALAARGYVERLSDDGDRRVRRIHLLPAGRAAISTVRDAVDRLRTVTLAPVPDADLAAAVRVMRRMVELLDRGVR